MRSGVEVRYPIWSFVLLLLILYSALANSFFVCAEAVTELVTQREYLLASSHVPTTIFFDT